MCSVDLSVMLHDCIIKSKCFKTDFIYFHLLYHMHIAQVSDRLPMEGRYFDDKMKPYFCC